MHVVACLQFYACFNLCNHILFLIPINSPHCPKINRHIVTDYFAMLIRHIVPANERLT